MKGVKCHKLKVGKEICYVLFKKDKVFTSKNEIEFIDKTIPLYTNRGEMVVIDFNKKGEMIGIELVSDDKPCQRITKSLAKK